MIIYLTDNMASNQEKVKYIIESLNSLDYILLDIDYNDCTFSHFRQLLKRSISPHSVLTIVQIAREAVNLNLTGIITAFIHFDLIDISYYREYYNISRTNKYQHMSNILFAWKSNSVFFGESKWFD